MKGSIKEYRKGHYRCRLYHKGQRIELYKYKGLPLDHPSIAQRALEWLNVLIDQKKLDPSQFTKGGKFRFENAWDIYISSAAGVPEWKAQKNRTAKKIFIPFFQGMDIREIQSIDLDRLAVELGKRGLSQKTIHIYFDIIGAFFSFHRKSIPSPPVLPKITFQEPPIKFISMEDQDRIFEFIPETHLPIFTFLRFTATRPSEARGLLRKNVFLDADPPHIVIATTLSAIKNELREKTKTKRLRILPIVNEIKDSIKPREVTPFVFSYRGKPYRHYKLSEIWAKANRAAHDKYGTKIINLYCGLKHSFGVSRLNMGYDLSMIAQIMGHTNTQTTKRYAEYLVENLAPAMSGVKRMAEK